jgi:hypothetical protein
MYACMQMCAFIGMYYVCMHVDVSFPVYHIVSVKILLEEKNQENNEKKIMDKL